MAEFKLIDDTIKLIAASEGCRLIAYEDNTGYAIGYGSHLLPNGSTVKKGNTITQEQADQLLKQRVENEFFPHAKRILKHSDINDYQAGAVTSLIYNLGIGQITSKSSVIKAINANPEDYDNIEKLFAEWRLDGNRQVSKGLCIRRAREFHFYKEHEIKMDVPYEYNPNLGGYAVNDESDAVVGNSKNETKYINTNYCASIKCYDEPEPVVGNGDYENYSEDIRKINNASTYYTKVCAIKILCNMDISYKLEINSITPYTYIGRLVFDWMIKDKSDNTVVGGLVFDMHETDYKDIIVKPKIKNDIIQGIANKINAQYRDTGPKIEINFKSHVEDDQYKLLQGWLRNNGLNKDDTMINNGSYDAIEKFILRCMRYIDMKGDIAGMEKVLFNNGILGHISGRFKGSQMINDGNEDLFKYISNNQREGKTDIKTACEQFLLLKYKSVKGGSINKYNAKLVLKGKHGNLIKDSLKLKEDENVLHILGYGKTNETKLQLECDFVIILACGNNSMRLINYLKL